MSPLFSYKEIVQSPDFSIEQELVSEGYKIIAGVDEAGRGALAGPLSMALVIYDFSIYDDIPDELKKIKDSKKLTHSKRLDAFEIIKRNSLALCHEFIHHEIIDEVNINGATSFGLKELISKSPVKPDMVIIDGNYKFKLDIPYVSVVQGDAKSISVASASIIAKVKRDLFMEELDKEYPLYEFALHKGYGTSRHLKIIRDLGASPIHRKTYEPIKTMIEMSCQGSLFHEDI
jgi:ribonuclease HII